MVMDEDFIQIRVICCQISSDWSLILAILVQYMLHTLSSFVLHKTHNLPTMSEQPPAKRARVEPEFSIAYWSIRGLGAPLRMMAMYAKRPVTIVNYDVKMDVDSGKLDASAWYGPKKELKKKNAFINLPHLTDHAREDMVVSQTNACLTYLARRLGLGGRIEADVVLIDTLLCEVMDLRNKMIRFAYNGALEDLEKDGRTLLEEVMAKNGIAQKFELFLASREHSAPCLLSYVTAADFHLWEMVDQYRTLAAQLGVDFSPSLLAWWQKFADLEENRAYLDGHLHNGLPFNNKSARFGSAPGGKTFERGQAYQWASKESEQFNC